MGDYCSQRHLAQLRNSFFKLTRYIVFEKAEKRLLSLRWPFQALSLSLSFFSLSLLPRLTKRTEKISTRAKIGAVRRSHSVSSRTCSNAMQQKRKCWARCMRPDALLPLSFLLFFFLSLSLSRFCQFFQLFEYSKKF